MTMTVPSDTAGYYQRWLAYRQWFLRIPGVQVAVAVDGEPLLSCALGVAGQDTGTPLTERHLFRIASHSKTFTAVLVLQLVEQGRLRLDDTVGERLPELASSPLAAVTVRELLAHGGGVIRDSTDGDFWQLMRDFPDRDALIGIVTDSSAAVLVRNERFKYSNIGYGLLGLIIEAVSGASFAEQVAERIVGPLGLADLGPELVESRRAELAAGHSALLYSQQREQIPHINTGSLAAATGFYSTAADLVAFYSALLPGRDELLSADSLRLLCHRSWDVKGAESGYGLGVFLTRIGDHELFGHSGGYPGHITRTLACPDRAVVVSALTNAIDGAAEPLAAGLFRLLDLADSGSQPAAEDAGRFVGRFSSLWGVLDIAAIGGRLFAINPSLVNPADDAAPLEVIDQATLKIVGGPGGGSYGELIRYEFAEDGSVASIRAASGMTMRPFELPAVASQDWV